MDRRPNLFLMIDSLGTGGSERQFATVAKSLNHERFMVRLGCLKRRGPFLEGLEDVAEFNAGGSFLTLQSHIKRIALARHLRAHKVAIANSFDFYSNLMMIPVARLAGVPIVIGSHRQLGNFFSPMQFRAQDMVFHLCDRIICNSGASAAQLLDRGLPSRKIVIIPNGLPNAAFADAEPSLPRRPGVLRVGMIARMNYPVKNYPMLLRAAARLHPKFPNLEFLLIGDGPLRPELEQMARQLGIEQSVMFLGTRHDIAAVLASMDIAVLTSTSESLSNVILESMAAGKPVVATQVGGNAELVRDGETGFLIPTNDDERLAGAIEHLLERPALRLEWGRRARELAAANFSLSRARDRYEELYSALIGQKSWRPKGKQIRSRPQGSQHRMRVVLVAPSTRWIGGHSVQADLLIRLWKDDPDVEARFIPINPDLPRWLVWVERIPFLRTAVRTPLYLNALWRGLGEVDIAHIFSASYWSFLLAPFPAWLVARARGKKVLINYRSGEARDHLARWRTALWVLRRADEVVVPSQYLVEVFREFGFEPKPVPNLVDLGQFRYRARKPLRPVLICTRGFRPYYRVDLVVRAFAEIKRKYPEARLRLVGEGPLEQAIRAQVRELDLNDVEFSGMLSREAIGREYDEADIFINASDVDNMPASVLEAFASGTPVVTTDAGGIRFIVEHERTGLLCPTGQWQALADNAIRLLLDHEFATRLAANAFEESRRYHWEAVRKEWLRVYQALCPPGVKDWKKEIETSALHPLEANAISKDSSKAL